MASKFLSALSTEKYNELTDKLHVIQSKKCFICQERIDISLHDTNIDHIVPLANRGKDNEENFALTHASCNKSKQDANLQVARVLYSLKNLQDKVQDKENRAASLKDLLQQVNGSRFHLKYKIENCQFVYTFSEYGDEKIYTAPIFTDPISQEETVFLELPIEYIYHDELINPRGINSSISMLVKEFFKKNPQLHLSLARLSEGQIKLFDGQHKAAAQILLGAKKILVRLFINPEINRLIETNTNAGSSLRQIAFDKSVMRQLGNTLYLDKIRKYQADHSLGEDEFNFSEEQLVNYFKGEANIKKYIIDSIKHSITYDNDNKLKDFVDFEGKAKELPISYSAFDKALLTRLIDSKLVLKQYINDKSTIGKNPRELEISQIVKLLNIIAEEIYIGKFNPEVGVFRIEQKIIDNKDKDIRDEHLIAYRMSKEEILSNWIDKLKELINHFFVMTTGKTYNTQQLFQEYFPDQLWNNIQIFIQNLSRLPLWKDKTMAGTHFSGKNSYDFWKIVFETGQTRDGVPVLTRPINHLEMINQLY